MQSGQARKFLRSVFSRDDDAVALSRRDMLAGLGLAGLFLAAPKLLSSAAEAKTLAPAVEPEAGSADAANSKVTEQRDVESKDVAASGDVTEFSAHRRRYRHRHWRRRYWRHRYWRRRHWRRRYWRRRRYW